MNKIFFQFTIICLLSSCSMRDSSGTDEIEDHGDEQESLELTLFSDSCEYFSEYSTLREGEEAIFNVHITRLSDYKPFTEGRIRLRLHGEGGSASFESMGPVRKGIWSVPVKCGAAGSCRISLEFAGGGLKDSVTFDGLSILALESEGGSGVAGNSHLMETSEVGEVQDAVNFTKEAAWNTDFGVGLIRPTDYSSSIKAGGVILAMPGEKHYIHSRSAGIVNYSKKDLVAGAGIKRDEEMMIIEGRDMTSNNIGVEYAEAETQFRLSKSAYQRNLRLLRENAVSEKKFMESRSAYTRDSLLYYNLGQSFTGSGLRISSPISGHIHELLVAQGEYVETGALIATISSDEKLLLRADVPQQYYPLLNRIRTANFRPSYMERALELSRFEGRLIAVGSSVQENSHYLPVYFEAINDGGLLEGAYAEFYLKTHPLDNSIVVPAEAVIEEQGKHFVFVQIAGESYEKREVFLEESDGISYRVGRGLEFGERVVFRGSMMLKAASLTNALPVHSHDH